MVSASFRIAAWAVGGLVARLGLERGDLLGAAVPSAIFLRITARRLTSAMRSGSSPSENVAPGRPQFAALMLAAAIALLGP